MVSQVINVIVNSKGAVTVARELDHIGQSARQTTTYLNGLRAVLAAALTFSGISNIVEVADQFTVLQNRLKLVADEQSSVADSWTRLLNIADTSYSTIDGTINLYYRVAQAYKAWGESAEAAYEFTELFQKAAILSGSSVQTTAQAVYQFSQALNKGKLDGDEFRSVLEGLPYVATLIQQSLGVTRAQLYELSADGQISLDKLKKAFEDAAETIRSDFANVTPTIGMAMSVLRNNWTDFVGRVQNSTGVFSAVAYLIISIANNFDLLAITLTPVAAALTFLAGRLALGLVVIGFQQMFATIKTLIPLLAAFNAILWANPLILVTAGITALVGLIIYFRNEIGLTNEVLYRLWTTITSTFSTLMEYLSPITSVLAQIVEWFLQWSVLYQAIRLSAQLTGDAIVTGFKIATTSIKNFVKFVGDTLKPLFSEIIGLAQDFAGLIQEVVDIHVNAWGPAVETVWDAIVRLWSYAEPSFNAMIDLIGKVVEGWKFLAEYITKNFWPGIRAIFEGWVFIIKEVISFIRNLIQLLTRALSLMKQLGGGGGGGGAHYGAQFSAQNSPGFAQGGAFKVGGTGAGRDTTPVAFRAERGERVTVETKKQQRQNDAPATTDVRVPVDITNVLDPRMMPAANLSAEGQKSILNVITANRDEIMAILGVV